MLFVKRISDYGSHPWAIWDSATDHEIEGASVLIPHPHNPSESFNFRPIYFRLKREAQASLQTLLAKRNEQCPITK